MPYGSTSTDIDIRYNAARSAVDRLHIMHEGRENESILKPIRELIASCNKVGFLGFGFDRINVGRINGDGLYNNESPPKRVVATTIGMTAKEVERVKTWLFGRTEGLAAGNSAFLPDGCLELLRKTLILEA